MGRTRRRGPRPPMTTAALPCELVDTLNLLKQHKDAPLYQVIIKLLDERENHPGIERLHKRLTSFCTGFDIVLQELYDKGIVLDCINNLDEHMQSSVRSFLKEKQNNTTVHHHQ